MLVRPRNAENVGAVARAMRNFGLRDWAWVDPQFGDLAPARRLAVHAQELLGEARIHPALGEAIADCAWVVGTSSRRIRGKQPLSPREVAARSAALGGAELTAIVFGDERSGLTSAEVDRCHELSAIPTAPEQPSVNLAQSALLYCYELRLAALAASPGTEPSARLAPDGALARVEEALTALLSSGGFLVQRGRRAERQLWESLRRARLSAREAALWTAALRSVAKHLGPGGR